MPSRILFLAVLLLAFPPGDGGKDGRRGNALYEHEDYAAAAEAYEAGLAAYGDGEPGAVPAGLLNNLGMALHQQEDYEAATDAFTRSMGMAATEANYARAAYNAGNNAYAMQELEGALDFYKKALLANPDDEAAKFNYEYVKRQLDQQQQQQGGDQNQDQQDQQDQQNEGDQNQDQQNQGQQSDQDGEQDQDQQGQGQQDQQDEQDQQDQQPQDGEQPGQEQPQPPPNPNELSQAQAERILQALQNDEEELLRQVMRPKTPARRVEKDW